MTTHHYDANMPGAVGPTSTFALFNVTLPWAMRVADIGIEHAMRVSQPIRTAVNIHQGKVTSEAVAETFGMEFASN